MYYHLSRITCFAAYSGEVEREVARTPRAPAGGLAALLHLQPSEAFCVHGTSAICTSVASMALAKRVSSGDQAIA